MSEVKTRDWADKIAQFTLERIHQRGIGDTDMAGSIAEALRSVERRTAEECRKIASSSYDIELIPELIAERFHLEGK